MSRFARSPSMARRAWLAMVASALAPGALAGQVTPTPEEQTIRFVDRMAARISCFIKRTWIG